MNRPTRTVVTSAALSTLFALVAHAGVLRVVVHDARTRTPIAGAFVQVGSAPGAPFANNWGATAADGSITFNDAALVGPQTVTAGAAGFSLLTVIEAASDSITLPLHAETIGATIEGPKAEISGTTVGIQTANNDGNVDVGVVYPALQLADVLGRRTAPVEIPMDQVSFPVVGAKDLPGNIVIPRQTEYLVYRFEKPNYHFFVPDRDTYDVVVLAGRASVSNLGSASLNDVTTRRVGIERVAVNGSLSLVPACDLDLSPTITVRVPDAPTGTAVEAVSVADVPEPGGPRTLLYDLKSSMAQDLDHFTLSGLAPTGDLSTSVPYVAARYHDPAPSPAYEAGRVDRTPLTLPATRSVEGFFLVPQLSQNGSEFTWGPVGRPGITTDPTWAIANFRLEPGSRMLWEVWSPAGRGAFALPGLAPGAPGGLPDSALVEDHLIWDLLVADPTGPIQNVLANPFATLTRYSRRSMQITPPLLLPRLAAATHEPGSARPIALAPQPSRGEVDIVWTRPPQPGDEVQWSLVDVTGRRVNTGRFRALGTERERAPWSGALAPAPGVYWLDLEMSGRHERARLVVVH